MLNIFNNLFKSKGSTSFDYISTKRNKKKYHQNIANYFGKQPIFFDDNQNRPNNRKLTELPWQLVKAELWHDVIEIMESIVFLEAKIFADKVYELTEDFTLSIESIPFNNSHRKTLQLIFYSLRRYMYFIMKHTMDYPQAFFQCTYNMYYQSNQLKKILNAWYNQKRLSSRPLTWIKTILSQHYSSDDSLLLSIPSSKKKYVDVSIYYNSDTLLCCSEDGFIDQFSIKSGTLKKNINTRIKDIGTICCASNSNLLAVGTYSGKIYLLDNFILEKEIDCQSIESRITSLCFSKFCKYLAFGTEKGFVGIVDLLTLEIVFNKKSEILSVFHISFTNGKSVKFISKDGNHVEYKIDGVEIETKGSNKYDRQVNLECSLSKQILIKHHLGGYGDHNDPSQFEIISKKLSNNTDNVVLKTIIPDEFPKKLSISPDCNFLAILTQNGVVNVFDTNRSTMTKSNHEGHIGVISFSPNDRYIAFGSGDEVISILDINRNGRTIFLYPEGERIGNVYFSEEDSKLVANAFPGVWTVFSLPDGNIIDAFETRSHGFGAGLPVRPNGEKELPSPFSTSIASNLTIKILEEEFIILKDNSTDYVGCYPYKPQRVKISNDGQMLACVYGNQVEVNSIEGNR